MFEDCVNRSTAKAAVQCQGHGRAEVVQAQHSAPGQKIRLISCGTMSHVSDIKLIRTDTTLDLSQKAEKGILNHRSDSILFGSPTLIARAHYGTCPTTPQSNAPVNGQPLANCLADDSYP